MLLTSQSAARVQKEQESEPEPGSIEALRNILALKQGYEVALSDAQEIGASLIEFYQTLAQEAVDESTD